MAVRALGSPPTSHLLHNLQAKPAFCAIWLQLKFGSLIRFPWVMHRDQQMIPTTPRADLDEVVGGTFRM